LVAAQV
jgi:hypothetical protein